ITEALSFLHYSGQVIHKNVCPSSILITKKGTWKLAGFEFTERTNETDATDPVPCQPWSTRASKLVQPNLDYMAPEIQINSSCSILSDMFSLGMVICAIFNHGRSLIQSGNSPSTYLKQMELVGISGTLNQLTPTDSTQMVPELRGCFHNTKYVLYMCSPSPYFFHAPFCEMHHTRTRYRTSSTCLGRLSYDFTPPI
uniref:Protein kinase domain-containing protein n=1 Tax=Anopheles maculatus TaxID=74869 RepID=A0A182SWW9_9DIPT